MFGPFTAFNHSQPVRSIVFRVEEASVRDWLNIPAPCREMKGKMMAVDMDDYRFSKAQEVIDILVNEKVTLHYRALENDGGEKVRSAFCIEGGGKKLSSPYEACPILP